MEWCSYEYYDSYRKAAAKYKITSAVRMTKISKGKPVETTIITDYERGADYCLKNFENDETFKVFYGLGSIDEKKYERLDVDDKIIFEDIFLKEGKEIPRIEILENKKYSMDYYSILNLNSCDYILVVPKKEFDEKYFAVNGNVSIDYLQNAKSIIVDSYERITSFIFAKEFIEKRGLVFFDYGAVAVEKKYYDELMSIVNKDRIVHELIDCEHSVFEVYDNIYAIVPREINTWADALKYLKFNDVKFSETFIDNSENIKDFYKE